jgi:hypothetical protein
MKDGKRGSRAQKRVERRIAASNKPLSIWGRTTMAEMQLAAGGRAVWYKERREGQGIGKIELN